MAKERMRDRRPAGETRTALRIPVALGRRLDRFASRNSLTRNASAAFLLADALERQGFPMLAEDELDGPA